MTIMQHKTDDALSLATRVADRYGRLALARAAGEAAAAERQGDKEGRDLWTSVVACLRMTIQNNTAALA